MDLPSPLSANYQIPFHDLPWPLPVGHYLRSHATVLSRKPEVDQFGNSIYYTYAIRFGVVEVGWDPTQLLASDFALITPGVLDPEVAQMSINLYLPSQACVKANISECREVALNPDQVELIKHFNTWLFNVVLGKPNVSPSGAVPELADSMKGYYVLPLQPNKSRPVEFDWKVVRSSLVSGLLYRTEVKFFGGFSKLEVAETDSDTARPGKLVMRNGVFLEDDLDDALITCAHNGLSCYVIAISKQLNGSSCFPVADNLGSQSFKDYYALKCDYVLKCPNQPLLKGKRLSRASNYLKRHETGTSAPKTSKTSFSLELPPEICLLHTGIKGQLFRGAMRLPSVLHRLEMALLAAELRDLIGVPISCFKVLQALTSRAYQGDVSYEALELLGDSILKVTGCTYLYSKDFVTREHLAATLYELVRNKTLYYCALARSLARYAFAEPFAPGLWVPPGLLRVDILDNSCPEKEQRQKFQMVSCKTLADIVEALIGAYLMDGGLDHALKAMAWLCVPIEFPTSIPNTIKMTVSGLSAAVDLSKVIDVDALESKIGYTFRDKNLLAATLKYDSHNVDQNLPYLRLEFLGDGLFDYLITRHLVRAYPEQDEGRLSDLKAAIRNNENLACAAVLHGLHMFLRRVSPSLEKPIAEYISSFMEEGVNAFGLSTIQAPKGLGHCLQTLAAGIFLDSDLDLEVVWQVIRPLLEPLPTPLTVTVHPIRQLETLCLEKGWSLEIHSNQLEKYVQAEICINKMMMGNSQNEDRRVARRLAATMALRAVSIPNGTQSGIQSNSSDPLREIY